MWEDKVSNGFVLCTLYQAWSWRDNDIPANFIGFGCDDKVEASFTMHQIEVKHFKLLEVNQALPDMLVASRIEDSLRDAAGCQTICRKLVGRRNVNRRVGRILSLLTSRIPSSTPARASLG